MYTSPNAQNGVNEYCIRLVGLMHKYLRFIQNKIILDLLFIHAEFTRSCCLASYGSWLLMFDPFHQNLYITNPLTLERIDLPQYSSLFKDIIRPCLAGLWVDNITRNYLVWILNEHDHMVYTRKGDGMWRRTASIGHAREAEQIVYHCKNQKVYMTSSFSREVFVWDFSDDIPRQPAYLVPFDAARYAIFDGPFKFGKACCFRKMIAAAVSGQVLHVACLSQDFRWQFRIYQYDPLTRRCERVDDLGDEDLILNMGFTVVAKDIPGMKRNSIYFSGIDQYRKDHQHIFVYDLGTRTVERSPQWVVSSVRFSDGRWFFPDMTH